MDKLTEEDLAAVAGLESRSFSDAWTPGGIRSAFCGERSVILAAKEERRLIGYCIVYFAPDEAELVRIAVDEAYRRQGVGCGLLRRTERVCGERGIVRLLLEVRESNAAARSFYLQNGFVEDGIRKQFYEHPREHAILMSKPIGSAGNTSHWECG